MRLPNTVADGARAQTLDRGLAALELVALAEAPMAVDDVAADLGLHRSIVYRLLRTLEDRDLVERDAHGRYGAGLHLAVLARHAHATLRSAAADELSRLAARLAMTAFLVVRRGDEAITIDVVEPRATDVHLVYRPGTRHPVDRGAPGLALLAAEPATVGERTDVTRARRRGWASSRSEVLPGMASIAAPVGTGAALAVLWLAAQTVDTEQIAAAVTASAAAVALRVG